jgi:hypothetical protein
VSFTTILRWDHDKKKQVRQKIWLKPENSMKEIMNSDKKRLQNQGMGEVTMITLGRTPKNEHRRCRSDFTGKFSILRNI